MIQIAGATAATPRVPSQLTALKQQFQASPYWSIRQLVCHIDRERIAVRGSVPSFYLKQIAQTLAVKALGADGVQSEIDVESE